MSRASGLRTDAGDSGADLAVDLAKNAAGKVHAGLRLGTEIDPNGLALHVNPNDFDIDEKNRLVALVKGAQFGVALRWFNPQGTTTTFWDDYEVLAGDARFIQSSTFWWGGTGPKAFVLPADADTTVAGLWTCGISAVFAGVAAQATVNVDLAGSFFWDGPQSYQNGWGWKRRTEANQFILAYVDWFESTIGGGGGSVFPASWSPAYASAETTEIITGSTTIQFRAGPTYNADYPPSGGFYSLDNNTPNDVMVYFWAFRVADVPADAVLNDEWIGFAPPYG